MSCEEIIAQFESLKEQSLSDAVKYLSSDPAIVSDIRESIRSQLDPERFTPLLFQWLYGCAHLRPLSRDLHCFVLQFSPDLLMVYLYAVYENNKELKANCEALLMVLVLETEKDKPPPLQVPVLSRPSIYHMAMVQVSQPSLTEAVLQRHDQAEVPPPRHSFSGKDISVNNRLTFLSTLMAVFTDHMMLYPPASQTAFCHMCIRLALQGMGNLCGHTSSFDRQEDQGGCSIDMEELGKMRRYSVNDALLTSLLHGVRMCMFQSCHTVALQALQALRMRAEYELLTSAMQVSHALLRLSQDVNPSPLLLEPQKYSTYRGEDKYAEHVDMAGIHAALNGHILYDLQGHTGETPVQPPLLAASNVQNWEQSPDVRSLRKTGGGISPQSKNTAV